MASIEVKGKAMMKPARIGFLPASQEAREISMPATKVFRI